MKGVESSRFPLQGGKVWPLSVAVYRALGEMGLIPKNTELLYGVVYTKMSKSPYHSSLAVRLARLIQAAVSSGVIVRLEQPVTCVDSEPEPDVAVVCGSEEDFWSDHPHTAELVAEICVTSHEYDKSKIPAYAAAGVKEIWLVLGPEKQIEVLRRPADGKYSERTLHGPGGKLTSTSLPGFTLELDSFFAK